MTGTSLSVATLFGGWHTYQNLVIAAITPLSSEQLALRAAPTLRSIDEIARHMIGARARWFGQLMGEGGDEFVAMSTWDRQGMPPRHAGELVHGLQSTWDGMQQAIVRWTPAEWAQSYPGEDASEPETITRHWVIWHLIEHDLHHGGELSLTLGMHGLRAPDL